MRVAHQVIAFEKILASYDGVLPLHRFLPTYFKLNKQMGSSDRRWATRHLYSFFRLGKALPKHSNEIRLAISDFLCHDSLSLIVEKNLPYFVQYIKDSLIEKINLVKTNYADFDLKDVFPFEDHLCHSINKEEFFTSFFVQPDLFIRIDELDKHHVLGKLQNAEVSFTTLSETAVALPNGTKLETILPEGVYQVQDLSSQFTGTYFKPNKWDKWWDCCAASGGKTLLLHSLQPVLDLLVTDLRESILNNLDERFRLAGIKKYHKKELDLLQNNDQILHHYQFDGIILDAPCTGSGTWGRTPEMLTYFQEKKINQFSTIQKAIVQNVVKYLKTSKPIIYITCSAFKEENEDVVAFMTENLPLKLEKMEVLKGYGKKADTMFVARLIKIDQD
ncbi:RsmB/NOP family class I SAM-dependent RNA methyltransferase [Pedobacter changchengzhani]|uniref:RsmB/NOP family class I SAM-dependent RNA methyltransferase n=1 Tax=Pedobacter changchengzhani TaxID=2529274 RepID=A0A4R5MHT4_9SPHI|nr:RsmB/NOP family class I SAM-dependent RNA methyltransferase [Pedobacter changchengzhani]TDG35127.1 RsmB/NOP family class I SAM-dependent RNA methyltransferase [Pedobacter changchengzhani]